MIDVNMVDEDLAQKFDLSRESIAEETSLQYLGGLFKEVDEFIDILCARAWALHEMRLKDTDEYRRLSNKLQYQRIGYKIIERRILELGGRPEYSPTDPRSRELTQLNKKINVYAKIIREYVDLEVVSSDLTPLVEHCKGIQR